VARSASCAGKLARGDAARDHHAHGLDRRRRVGRQLAELVVLDEKKKPKSRGFSSYARQKPAIIAAALARARFRFASFRSRPANSM